jgi:hypothetical protein
MVQGIGHDYRRQQRRNKLALVNIVNVKQELRDFKFSEFLFYLPINLYKRGGHEYFQNKVFTAPVICFCISQIFAAYF